MAVRYETQTFHLNVGIGECTVVCRRETDIVHPSVLPKLHNVVLIDSGFPSWFHGSRAAAVIRQFFTQQLILLFDVSLYPLGIILIDTVVITHWDRDHYGGIASLLVDDLTPVIGQPPRTQCTLFKYALDGTPLTWMYVPYMVPTGEQGDPDHMFAISDHSPDRLKFDISTNPRVPQWFDNICLLRYGAEQVLGVNFFTNTQNAATLVGFPERDLIQDIVPVTAFATPALLINPFADVNDGDPGLFCVGCNNFVFQAPPALHLTPTNVSALPSKTTNTIVPSSLASASPTHNGASSSSGKTIQTGPHTSLHPNVFIIDKPAGKTKSEQINSASIMTILAWKDTASERTRVSHYLAGDALWEQEAALTNWLAPTCDVANLKLSHHGAAKSSPASLIKELNPVNIVVSAGTEHGHPRECILSSFSGGTARSSLLTRPFHPGWELLLWLNGWRRADDLDSHFIEIVPLCYPYYLAFDDDGNPADHLDFSITALNPVPDGATNADALAFRAYQAALTELPEYSAASLNFVAEYQQLTDGWTDRAKRGLLQQSLALVWSIMSNVPPDLHPFQDPNNGIYYISVASSRTDEIMTAELRGAIAYPGRGTSSTRKHPKFRIPVQHTMVTRHGKRPVPPKQAPVKAKRARVVKQVLGKAEEADADDSDPEEGDEDDDEELEMKSNFAPFLSLTALTTNTLASTSSPPLPPTGYFICASDEAVIAAINVFLLHTDDPLDSFFQDLHNGYLGFEAIPNASGVKLLDTADFTDEVVDWFIKGLGADSMTVKGLGAASPSALSVKFSAPIPMTFSTEAIKIAFGWDTPNPLPPCGYISALGTMIFGLDWDPTIPPTPLMQSSLSGMLTFLGLPGDHLLALDVTAKLVLDTQPANRNAIWFSPWNNYETVLRLQFKLIDEGILTSFIKNNVSSRLNFSTPRVIVRKSITWSHNSGGFECVPETQIIFAVNVTRVGGSTIETIFTFDRGVMTIIMRPSDGTLLDLLGWMADLTGANKADVMSISNWVSNVSNKLPTVLELRIQATPSGIQAFSVVMELEVDFGKTSGQSENVAFLITYRWSAQAPHHTLNGSIWCPVALTDNDPDNVPLKFDPSYEALLIPVQPTFTNLTPFLHMSSLFPGTTLRNIPAEIDLGIFSANLTITSDDMTFEGVLVRDPSQAPPTFAISLGKIDLGGRFRFSSSTASRAYDICLSASINIVGQTPDDSAMIFAAVSYDSTAETWELSGRIQDLKMTTLLQFFPQTDSTVMDIMGHLEIKKLGIDYKYGGASSDGQKAGVGSYFFISGSLLIDVFELDMSFERDASKSWQLTANLGLAGQGGPTTIVQLLDSLINDPAIVGLIPSFANFDISPGNGNGLSLIVTKSTAVDGFITFILSLKLGGDANTPELSFNLIQIKSTDSSKKPPTKRVIRVSVESIPFKQIPNIPLVGSLKQPFDEMDYIWVHDDAGLGLTRQEIGCINAIQDFSGVKYRDMVAQKDWKPSDILLASGSHFLVTADDSGSPSGSAVILDYVFGRPDPPGPKPVSGAKIATRNLAAAPADGPEGDTSMAKLQQSQGPLTIANFGLRYSDNTLSVLFDATVKLGPIEFALLGFGFSLKFNDGITLRSLSSITPSVSLSGMAIEFNNPPIEIAGIFEDLSTADQIKYLGGVVLGMEPYSFTAVGSYGEITDKTGHSFKSVFVFCQLEGPLIELEFAEIQGITAGFGYNSFLRYPTIDEVDSFPFINDSYGNPGTDPLALLVSLTDSSQPPKPGTGWISSREGPLWLAAGLEVKAFQTLSVQAVVVLEFNPYVSLGIFAKAIAAIPAPPEGSPSANGAFVYAELGIVSSIDFHAGTMLVQAKLSPNSFILAPSCHLSGGFALCQWFGASEHAGDWVFTVGGYHPAYTPPSHYPLVDRLQISWDLGGGLSVTGQAYFAITPKVCMGGGSLAAVLNVGALSAYFRAHADFLINYSPFHFVGDIGVSVGIEFTLDLWICTIHISVDIGAQVHLQGPPFGGYVYVDFWVFGFTVHFGDSGDADNAIDLPAFWQLLLQQPGDTPTTALSAISEGTHAAITAAPANDHVLVVETDRTPGTSKTKSIATQEGAPWIVRPQGFTFRVQSRFAIGTASCNGHSEVVSPASIYAKPMHLTAGTGNDDQSVQSTLGVKVDFEESLGVFTCNPVIKKVPKALWGAYTEGEDPQIGGNGIPALLQSDDGVTVDLMMGVSVTAPPPYISADPIQPFDALAAMSENVYTDADHYTPTLPSSLTPSSAEWTPEPLANKAGDPAASWTAVQQAWKNPIDAVDGYDLATAVVAWAKALSWSTIPAGKLPSKLVGGIEQYYLSAPFVGQVV